MRGPGLWRIVSLGLALFFAGAAALTPEEGKASGSSSGNLDVTATVSLACTVSSPTLDFGGYGPVTTNAVNPLDSSTSITLSCSQDGPVTLGFDLGTNAQAGHCGGAPQRCMASGSNYLNYNLYASTNDRTSGSAWTAPVAETISGGTATVSIFGRVPGGQEASVGSYTDSVVATVYY